MYVEFLRGMKVCDRFSYLRIVCLVADCLELLSLLVFMKVILQHHTVSCSICYKAAGDKYPSEG